MFDDLSSKERHFFIDALSYRIPPSLSFLQVLVSVHYIVTSHSPSLLLFSIVPDAASRAFKAISVYEDLRTKIFKRALFFFTFFFFLLFILD